MPGKKEGPPERSGGPFVCWLRRRLAAVRRGRDLHPFAPAPRGAGGQRFGEGWHEDVEPVGVRPGGGTAVEQRLVSAGSGDGEIDLAVVLDIAVDAPPAVVEGVIP